MGIQPVFSTAWAGEMDGLRRTTTSRSTASVPHPSWGGLRGGILDVRMIRMARMVDRIGSHLVVWVFTLAALGHVQLHMHVGRARAQMRAR